jgi:hypothetical protein
VIHEESVAALAAKWKIPDPRYLDENLLGIARLRFVDAAGHEVSIDASHMNKASRLFFQDRATDDLGHRQIVLLCDEKLRAAGKLYFATKWDTAETHNRPLLIAFKCAVRVYIEWKDGLK